MPRFVVLVAAIVVSTAGTPAAEDPSAKSADKSPLAAQDTPKLAAPNNPTEFEARFADDSTVRLTVLDPTLGITTKYGKLTIPIVDIKRVDLGFRFPDGVEAKAEAAATALGSPGFRTREDAEKTLVGLGEFAVPAVRRALKSGDPEIVRRATVVMKRLKDKLTEEKFTQHDQDVVETTEFTVRGRLEGPGLKTRTRYFGEVVMRLNEVRGLRAVAASSTDGKVALDAAKHAKQGWVAWMDTGVDVSTDQSLEITCTGQIDQWSQTPGQYLSGPQGTQAAAPAMPNGRAVQAVPAGPGGQFVRSGAVIGRIGTEGPPFFVGAAFRAAKAPASGRLFLIVAPSNWGNDSIGTYEVKIQSGS